MSNKTMESEILNFHKKQAEIAELKTQLTKLEKEIIKKHCEFKEGDKVIFTEWWRGNGKDYFGIIKQIRFYGIDGEAINNRWVISVESTTKDFTKAKGGYNSSYKYLGKNKKDKIRKA